MSLSIKYRSFMTANMIRLVVTRLVSILYVIIVSRAIPFAIQDSMIILAYGQATIVQLSLFGIGISAVYLGRSDVKDDNIIQSALKSAFIFSLPITIGGAFIVRALIEISTVSFMLYVSAMTFQLISEYLYIYSDYALRSDKKTMGRTVYSVANSILVPSIFLFSNSLESILMAWNYAMILSLIYMRKELSAVFLKNSTDFGTMARIMRLGLPIYIANWINLIAHRLDIVLIYIMYSEGDTAGYYWILKISLIAQEMFMVMINGLFPLLVVAYNENTRERFISMVNSIMRVALVFGWSLYAMMIAYGRVAIWILISDQFLWGLIMLQVIMIGRGLEIPSIILQTVSSAEGKFKKTMWMNIIGDVIWIGGMIILLPLGMFGLALALVLNRVVQSVYMIWVCRDVFIDGVRAYYRISIFVFMMALLSYVSAYVFIFVYPVIVYMTRPLNAGDWDMIGRVLPVKKIPVLRKVFVNG